MERNPENRRDEQLDLGTASVMTLGNHGVFPEKETTMLTGAISDD